MFGEPSDPDRLRTHLDGVLNALDHRRLKRPLRRAGRYVPGDGTTKENVRRLLSGDAGAQPSSGGHGTGAPHLSRIPMISLFQSHLDESLQGGRIPAPPTPHGLRAKVMHFFRRLTRFRPGSMTPDDPNWYLYIAIAVLEHISRGNHDFNPRPAYREISDDARLVVVGDWGTGLPAAREVAERMQEQIAEALAAGRQVHVIHLGDVYYSGLGAEYTRRFLRYWPVTSAQARAGVTSWSLNGNHDMYSGGFGYFRTLLRDRRFAGQRTGRRKPTSLFHLRSPSWDFAGLDTSWQHDVATQGQSAVLEDPQAEFLSGLARDPSRKLVLFSHHQLVSAYERQDVTPLLREKLAAVLAGDRVTGWWWGHEHRAVAYEPTPGVRHPRCLGHGGVPVPPDGAPPAGDPAVRWHSSRTVQRDGTTLARSGFAVLDLAADHLDVRYLDDDGAQTYRERVE